MVLVLSTLLLALTATLANADSDDSSTYLSGLVLELKQAGLSRFSAAVNDLSLTVNGSEFFYGLSDTSHGYTVLAPTDEACKSGLFSTPPPRSNSNVLL
jgi:hypothetical protein